MKWYIIFISCFLLACEQGHNEKIDIQGHRGARGLAPENSLPGFMLATELGVNTLELDLVVSADSQLIVSHEPFFSPEICRDQFGDSIPQGSIINIYQLDYSQIKLFDCGSKGNMRFPEQSKISTYKPLLKDVIDSVESFVKNNQFNPINYNIELKTTVETDSVFHPHPSTFSDLTYSLLKEMEILDRVTIQSFDFRTLQYFNNWYPQVKLALLVENKLDWKLNLDSLGFTPEIYSPYYPLLSQKNVDELHGTGMKVIPWTVNELSDIKSVLALAVDGIITDYPDRAVEIIKE